MKKPIYILLILVSSCVTTKFLSVDSFDKPVNYSRPWDDSVTCIWLDNYDNIWEDRNGSFTLFADSVIASRLVTKDCFHVEPPFTITFEAKVIPANLALTAVWFFPVDDNNKFLVREVDCLEYYSDKMVFTLHHGNDGYGDHFVSQKHYDCDVTVWNKFKCKVTNFDVTWWINGKKIHHVKIDMGQRLYYLRLSIIMSKNYKYPELADIARFDIKNIKIKHF